MYAFHVAVHVRPVGELASKNISLNGRSVNALDIAGRLDTPFQTTFEAAAAALARLDRMFFEPDGAFVWVSEGESPWQVDGVLYDRDGRLLYVELKGRCPEHRFDLLLAALGWPVTQLVFQLLREAVIMDEAEFRRWASA